MHYMIHCAAHNALKLLIITIKMFKIIIIFVYISYSKLLIIFIIILIFNAMTDYIKWKMECELVIPILTVYQTWFSLGFEFKNINIFVSELNNFKDPTEILVKL